MKHDNIGNIASKTTKLNVYVIVICIVVFCSINYTGTEFLDYIFKTTNFVYNNQKPYVINFQKYIQNNNVRMTDTDKITNWVKNNNISYFTISVERELIYGVTFVDDFMLSGNAKGDLHKTWQYFHKVKFYDGVADVFIYSGVTEKYYMCMNIIAALVTVLTGLLAFYYGVRNEMNRLRLELENSKILEKRARESKDELIKGMAHDLRTPLTSLMAYAEIIKMKNESGNIDNTYIDKIIEKSLDIRNLTNQLFDFSIANQDGNIQMDDYVNVENAIGDYLSEFCCILQNQGYHINADKLYWGDSKISINTVFVSRIIYNLASNIVKYADIKETMFIKSVYEQNKVGIIIKNRIKIENPIIESSGIGLQNIEMMMKKMNGKLEVISSRLYFTVILWFPVE